MHALGARAICFAPFFQFCGGHGATIEIALEVVLTQLQGADVQRAKEVSAWMAIGPTRNLSADGFEDPPAKGQDEAGLLGDGDEFVGRNQAAQGWMLPPNRRFGSDDVTALDLRLVEEGARPSDCRYAMWSSRSWRKTLSRGVESGKRERKTPRMR